MRYYLLIVWIAFMAVAGRGRFQQREIVCSRVAVRYNRAFAALTVAPLVVLATLRGAFVDTYGYLEGYAAMPANLRGTLEYIFSIHKDAAFYAVEALIHLFSGGNPYAFLFAVAAFHAFCVAAFFRKYSIEYLLSIFLFVASADYVSWMFNGIRQFTAVCILLLGTRFYLDRKVVPALLVIALASLFHQSALLMLPFAIMAQGKAWNKWTLLFLSVALFALFFVDTFSDILDASLAGTQYSTVVSDYRAWQDDGTNPLRVMVYSAPAILSFLDRERIRKYGGRLINFCANMSVISMGLYLISMVTSGIFLGRLPIYCSLYGYILLPWLLRYSFDEQNRRAAWVVMLAGYLVYYWVSVRWFA